MAEEQREHSDQSVEVPAEAGVDTSRPTWRSWQVAVAICLLALLTGAVGYLAHDTVDSWEHKTPAAPGVAMVTPSGQSVSADQLKAAQETNGKRIMAAGMRMGMGRKAIVSALVTAMHRTTLLNMASQSVVQTRQYRYDYSWNRPDVGLFGESRRDLWVQMNPSLAAEAFFVELRGVEDWRLMTVPQIARYMQPDSGYESTVDAAEDFYDQNADEVADAVRAERHGPLPLTSGRTRMPDDDIGAESPDLPGKQIEDGPRLPTRVAGVPR